MRTKPCALRHKSLSIFSHQLMLMARAQLKVSGAVAGFAEALLTADAPTALSKTKLSTARTNSSILMSNVGVSVTGVALICSISRTMARNKGANRGCATLVKRICDDCNAANSGCTLPVSCDCCCARRMADSISTTRFSSRERDKLCIKSSSCARCSATSLNLASVTAKRAAVSRANSSACLALTRASTAWVDTSEVCLANISWMPLSLNTVQTETNAPINANAVTPAKAHIAN